MRPYHSLTTEEKLCTLVTLREETGAYHTAFCRLMHEQVVDVFTDTHSTDLESIQVKRTGFCHREQRSKQLGCAHTKANDEFAHLADEVYSAGILDAGPLPSIVLTNMFMKIYMLDQKKGWLEKRYAIANKTRCTAAETNSLKHELSIILSNHASVILEMEDFRKSILARLDEAINQLSLQSF